MPAVGETLLDHFERFLGHRTHHHAFGREDGTTALQVFGYDRVVEDCRVYITFGASYHFRSHRMMPELLTVTDDGWDHIPSILAYAVRRLAANGVCPRPGIALNEVDHHWPEFGRPFGKRPLFLSSPAAYWPDAFTTVDFGHETDAHPRYGCFSMASFITPAEFAYSQEHGAHVLQDLLADREVDPTDLRRPSCL